MTSIPFPIPRRDNDMLRELRAPQGRPLLLTGGTVVTGNELLGGWQNADVLIGGNVIVGIGPGLLTAAGDDNMIVIDCAGTLALPAATDFTTPHTSATLTPGQSADIAVLQLADTPETPAGAAPARGSHLDLLITAGQVRLWDSRPLNETGTPTAPAPASEPAHDPSHLFLGMWVDDHSFVRQELLPDGRPGGG